MARVTFEGVSKEYSRQVQALRNISFEVEDGEFLVVVGPSGCGKTTLLRLVAGLEMASVGTVRLNGRIVQQAGRGQNDVAMVFQRHALYPHWTVRKNLEVASGAGRKRNPPGGWSLGARTLGWWRRAKSGVTGGESGRGAGLDEVAAVGKLAGFSKIAADSVAEVGAADVAGQVAQQLGMANLLDRFPGQLSGGEQQRVAIGKAWVRRPGVFLFDEPFAHLDSGWRTRLRRELQSFHRRDRVTMIYVTHEHGEALAMGNRVAVLHEGRLEQVGVPEEVYWSPRNLRVAMVFGDPPMNLVSGELHWRSERLWFRAAECEIRLDWQGDQPADRRVVLGVRPERVQIHKVGDLPVEGSARRASQVVGQVSDESGRGGPSGNGTYRVEQVEWRIGGRVVFVRGLGRAADRWAVWWSGSEGIREGDEVALSVDGEHAVLYDPTTGERLAR